MAISTKKPGIPVINIILVGSSGVGKASLKWRHIDGHFPDFIPKVYHLDQDMRILNDTLFYLDVTEIPGDEDYDKLRRITYSSCLSLSYTESFIALYKKENVVACMCFSVMDDNSFFRLKSKLIEEVREIYGNDVPMILLGTKSDLLVETSSDKENISQVSRNMIRDLAKEMNISKILMCSALTGEEVKTLIDEAIKMSPLFRDSFRKRKRNYFFCDLL